MTTSLSNHSPSARPLDGFDEDPYAEHSPDEARLRGLSHQQLADRLTWLAWYQPGTFTAVMDYMEFCDALAADADPASPGRDRLDYDEEPAPVCARCGADIGIFIKFGGCIFLSGGYSGHPGHAASRLRASMVSWS